MYLKRIEVHGFKSFADRTEIEFRPGITAVVGPNGSGKSNVSDALLWVLGEQNARTLRGEGSADLIFAGTERRRPLGMAEVSLSIDNSDRGLPLDFGEVTVTRRVYRSGEGECFINRTACRLKDIYELFLDTGVGRDAYSIIGQDEIHAVLSARGEERRELLEEAAGIKKYRHRRKEAQRKLEATRQNLTRVGDILGELEIRVDPLKIQAGVAERWQGLNARLREMEIGLLAIDLLRKNEELASLRSEREDLDRRSLSLSSELARSDAAEQAARLETTRLEGAIESVRRSRDAAREEALKREGEIAVARQQAVADASERLRLVAEAARCEARAEETDREAEGLAAERRELEGRLAEGERKAADHAPERRELDLRARDAAAALDRVRRAISEEAARKASLAEKARQLGAQIEESAGRIEAARKQAESLGSQRDAEAAREEQARRAAEEVGERLSGLQARLKALEAETHESRESHRAAQAALREKQTHSMRAAARLRSLEEMHRSLEGAYRGVKAVIQAARNGLIDGEFRVVADLLAVPAAYGVALEVALGSHAQDIVILHDREAQAAIRFLKQKNAGRATFLPLDLIRGDRMRAESGVGIHGVGVDLVEFPEEVRRAMEMLLGRVLIVEDMETAIRLVRRGGPSPRATPHATLNVTAPRGSGEERIGGRMVTLDGELIHPNGSLTGGSREGGPGILSRKLEIDRLSAEVARDAAGLQEEESAVAAFADVLSEMEGRREALRGEIAAARVELAQRESSLEHAGREFRRLVRERDDSESRLKALEARLDGARAQREEASRALAEAEAGGERRAGEEADARAAVEAAREAWEAARSAVTEVQLEITRSKERWAALVERAKRSDRTRREIRDQQEGAVAALEALDERRRRASGGHEALEKAVEERRGAAAALDAQLSELAGKRTLSLEGMAERAASLKSLAAERESVLEKAHRHEVREASLASDLEHLQLRLMVDYEAEPDHAPMLAEAVASRQNTAVEVNRLKREMSALGTVNLGAIEEYQRVGERVEFLSTQRADLEEAEATLLGVIVEIDATTQVAFRETFERVSAAFDGMFRRLFNGGRTQLVLTDPENVLETGIDIIVQPPGKKLQHLQLLSGGEKALTAVALLFALLEVKPSPFCLLDEVDAALDEANVGRFAETVQEFAKQSQFIIITHNKSTMAAADTLCGVTMEEPGISKILSVRLED